MADKNVLSVNAGSSSIKIDVVSVNSEGVVTETLFTGNKSYSSKDRAYDITALLDEAKKAVGFESLVAVGHRIVHGGPSFKEARLIDKDVMDELARLSKFAPQHMPAAILSIEIMQDYFKDLPHAVCFDTAFFADIPNVAKLLTIPRKYQAEGLRRYGFHGISYTYLLSSFKEKAGEAAANGRIIFAHLGSGASLAAVVNGKPIDMTMGFTPVSGIMNSSRTGDLDPGVLSYLHHEHNMSVDEFTRMVNAESGLLGVSELTADMYTLLQNEETNSQAAEAIELFVYQVRKTIGAFSAALGGVDSIVFSGGIGEQSSILRKRICDDFGYLGITVDDGRNDNHEFLISADDSRVGVHVIPTKESHVIVKQVVELIK